MTIECTACATPTDATLCHPCTRRLTAVLDDLPQWLAELATTAVRMAKTSGPDGGKATKKFEQPLPYHEPAAELLAQADTGLRSWVVYVADLRELPYVAGRPPASNAEWLSFYADEVRHTDRAAELDTAVRALRDACRRMVDNLGRRWAGPCTARVQPREIEVTIDDQLAVTVELGAKIGEPRECGADLRTRPGAKIITCPECRATYDPIDRAQWIIAKARDAQAGPDFLAEALTDAGWPLKPATIRQWASRGKLFSYRDDPRGRAMYRVGDVLDLVKAARTKAGIDDDTPRSTRVVARSADHVSQS